MLGRGEKKSAQAGCSSRRASCPEVCSDRSRLAKGSPPARSPGCRQHPVTDLCNAPRSWRSQWPDQAARWCSHTSALQVGTRRGSLQPASPRCQHRWQRHSIAGIPMEGAKLTPIACSGISSATARQSAAVGSANPNADTSATRRPTRHHRHGGGQFIDDAALQGGSIMRLGVGDRQFRLSRWQRRISSARTRPQAAASPASGMVDRCTGKPAARRYARAGPPSSPNRVR